MLAAHTKTLFWLGCTNKQSVQILLKNVMCSLVISDPKHKNVFENSCLFTAPTHWAAGEASESSARTKPRAHCLLVVFSSAFFSFLQFKSRRRSSKIGPQDLEPPQSCHLKTAVYLAVSCFWMNRPTERQRGVEGWGGAPLLQEAIILRDPMRRSTVSRRNCTVKRKSISDTLPRRWFECCGSSAFCLLGKTRSSLRGSPFHISQGKKISQRTFSPSSLPFLN